MNNENTVTFRMESFERGYEKFLIADRIHRSTKQVTPLAFEHYLGLVHVADYRNMDVFREYRIVNKERFDYGKVKFGL
jgi:hypothetical protein